MILLSEELPEINQWIKLIWKDPIMESGESYTYMNFTEKFKNSIEFYNNLPAEKKKFTRTPLAWVPKSEKEIIKEFGIGVKLIKQFINDD